MSTQTIQRIADASPAATYGGTAASIVFWGLNVNEVCAILSTMIAFAGLALQFFLASKRIRALEQSQGTTQTVVEAVAESHRALDEKVTNIAKTGA